MRLIVGRRRETILLGRKAILIVLLVLAAFGALPQLAAADPEFELHEHTSFTISGGAANFETKSLNVGCSSVTGSGKFENSQAGNIELAYHECKASGVSCTTAGQTTGTITVASSPFRVKSATEGKLALLITPKEEKFATFSCSILTKVVISGNGVVGIVTSPAYGEEKSAITLKFSGEKGVPAHKVVDGEETEYVLKASVNGGESAAVSVAGEIVLSFAGAIQPPAVKVLTILVSPIKDGTVLSSPVGIHCIWTCSAVFVQNTKVKLTVTELGLNFKEWKTKAGNPGTCTKATNPCQATLSADVSLEALFE